MRMDESRPVHILMSRSTLDCNMHSNACNICPRRVEVVLRQKNEGIVYITLLRVEVVASV